MQVVAVDVLVLEYKIRLVSVSYTHLDVYKRQLQRRSILELLTSKLIDDGILSGNATIKVKGGRCV